MWQKHHSRASYLNARLNKTMACQPVRKSLHWCVENAWKKVKVNCILSKIEINLWKDFCYMYFTYILVTFFRFQVNVLHFLTYFLLKHDQIPICSKGKLLFVDKRRCACKILNEFFQSSGLKNSFVIRFYKF